MQEKEKKVLIVGAGLAGLSAAYYLEKQGLSPVIIEQFDRVGGRVKTDFYSGFILDHGFQVISTGYPELKKLDILDELNLSCFESGACIQDMNQWIELYNPLSHPKAFFNSFQYYPKGSLSAFIKLAYHIYKPAPKDQTTAEFLNLIRLPHFFKELFLKSFFKGVFLEEDLKTPSIYFKKYLKSFVFSKAALPSHGIQALPMQLKERLHASQFHFNEKVIDIQSNELETASGRTYKFDALILTGDLPSVSEFYPIKNRPHKSCGVKTYYFSLDKDLITAKPLVYLGWPDPIVNACFLSKVQPTYAPKDKHLLAVNLIAKNAEIDLTALKELLAKGFHLPPKHLHFLKSYYIEHALPVQVSNLTDVSFHQIPNRPFFIASEVFSEASINGALKSGREAAHAACQLKL